jgi:hypothetical protein
MLRAVVPSWLMAVAVAAILGMSPSLSAHHSLQAGFDINKIETVTGVITKMDWRNPHAWLYIDVKDPRGQVTPYSIEFSAANQLYRRGWRQDDLPVGMTVTITGYVARDGTKTLTANEVKLADGRTLFGGAAPGTN